jgi:hypothetical protein
MKMLYGAVALLTFGGFAEELHSQTILQFEAPQNVVSGGGVATGVYGIEEGGFIFSAPRAPQFVQGGGLEFRNPSSGLGNANGLNTVPYNGTSYAVPFTSSQPVLQRADGSPFDLLSMDLAAYSASFSDTNTVTVTGYYASGGTITTDLIFNGTVVGEASDFHTFAFDSRWANLNEVVMFDSVPWASGVGFSIDNIAVSTIPEPEAPTLVSLFLVSIVLGLRYGRKDHDAALRVEEQPGR